MHNPTITPYLFFAGRCGEALEYYREKLGAQIDYVMKFSDSPERPPEGMLQQGFENKIMHASLRLLGIPLMASDGTDDKNRFDGFRLAVSVGTEEEAHRVFSALADGGNVIMPLAKTFWSPCYGMLDDRFGLGWMVMVPGEPLH